MPGVIGGPALNAEAHEAAVGQRAVLVVGEAEAQLPAHLSTRAAHGVNLPSESSRWKVRQMRDVRSSSSSSGCRALLEVVIGEHAAVGSPRGTGARLVSDRPKTGPVEPRVLNRFKLLDLFIAQRGSPASASGRWSGV